MRYLIDTHILLWYFDADEKLPKQIRDMINDPDNTFIISAASLWEIAIKLSKAKNEDIFKISLSELEENIFKRGYLILNIAFNHLNILPLLPQHHGDPFDRLIIAQAISENLILISVDKQFKAYPVNLVS